MAKQVTQDDVEFSKEAFYNLDLVRREGMKSVMRVEGHKDKQAALLETLEVLTKFAKARFKIEVAELEAEVAREEARKAAEAEAARKEAVEYAEAETHRLVRLAKAARAKLVEVRGE